MPVSTAVTFADRVARPYGVHLGAGPEPADVVRRLTADDQPAVLWGSWFGGGVIILRAPLLARRLAGAAEAATMIDDQPAVIGIPDDLVGGGWLGCLGFSPDTSAIAFHDHLLRWDPRRGWRFESLGLAGREAAMAGELERWRDLLAKPRAAASVAASAGTFETWSPATETAERYLGQVDEVIGMIDAGEVYQLNLCTRLRSQLSGDPIELFARMAEHLDPAYGGLLIMPAESGSPRRVLASFSPELFLRVRGGTVITSPIKGTAHRRVEDQDSPMLRASAKDAAENIMIVDLMRNDLSRVCRPGTVRVEELLSVQPHPGVWHLVSTVAGELTDGVSVGSLLAATFPPGSVTGAPKLAALTGICQLEPQARGAYTGTFGLSSPVAGADFNVIIRSLELTGDELELGVGGGITVDSVPINEWYECLTKAAPVVAAAGTELAPGLRPVRPPVTDSQWRGGLLETMLAVDGTLLRLAPHLARLDRSCRELYGQGLPDNLAGRVRAAVGAAGPGRLAVRVLARPADDRLPVTADDALRIAGNDTLRIDVAVAATGVPPDASRLVQVARTSVSWRHKWADRTELAAAEDGVRGELPYFLAPASEGGYVTETTRGNVFCRIGGSWLTPPLDEHLLPGVTRRDVLDILARLGIPVRIERFSAVQLRAATAAFWTSSLSGAVPVSAVDGHPLPSADELEVINTELGAR